MSSDGSNKTPRELLEKLVDVHCHPTDTYPVSDAAIRGCPMTVCAMSMGTHDQVEKVRALATDYPDTVIPCFGHHPWLTHTISLSPDVSKEDHYRALLLPPDAPPSHESAFLTLLPTLPDPTPLTDVLSTLRSHLLAFPHALLGEVGLDRAFRLRLPANAGDKPVLTPFTVPLEHQITILEAQMDIAVELRRHVSVHSVKAQHATTELFDRMRQRWGDKWWEISVDIHSCTLSVETWLDMEKRFTNVFLSLSTVINSKSPAHRALLSACDSTRILVESDFDDIAYSAPRTWDMVKIVAEVKGWEVEQNVWREDDEDTEMPNNNWGVVRRLQMNWRRFVRGMHAPSEFGKNRKERKPRREYPEMDSDRDEELAGADGNAA